MASSAPEILSPSGPVARHLGESFESRPEQLQMAAAVSAAMEGKGRLLVEAGTGVGKSFAYLVPAILRCLLNKERIVIATNTIALQEQLVQKDIPLLRETLKDWGIELDKVPELIPVLVKGRGNYVSIRRLRLASQRQESLLHSAEARRSLRVIEDWAYATKDGTLSTLPQLDAPEVWDHVRSDSDNCMGRKCETYSICFYQRARQEMERANLLVCNHALYFSDLALRAAHGEEAGILPVHHHVILDEAHNVEEVACEHFGVSLSRPRVMRLLRTLYAQRRSKVTGYLAQRSLAPGDTTLVDGAILLVMQAETAAEAFFDDLRRLHEIDRTGTGRIREPGVVENPLTPVMRSLALRLAAMREQTKSEPDKFELNSYAKRAGEIADAAAALVGQTMPDCVYWVEVEQGGEESSGGAGRYRSRPARVTIACSPIEAAPLLRQHLFTQNVSFVLTSATLATRSIKAGEQPERAETAFAYTMSRVGLDDARTLQLGSPFDYARQVELHIDTTVPDPRASGRSGRGGAPGRPARSADEWPPPEDETWLDTEGRRISADPFIEALSDRILRHVKATGGGAFVLFTSFAHLNAVADALRRPLGDLGLPLFAQNRDGPRAHILREFKSAPNAVLLGAASFWQGVDVRGDTLRNVIITRLPFEPPDRPLTQARLERITERGGNAFMEDSLPRAVIRFKQGFGRLIRSKTDTGRVVVLDPRVLTARYGQKFLDALPAGLQVHAVD